MRETKTINVKVLDEGIVEAVFSTLNVKDHDGDVTLPGAFQEGATLLASEYGHSVFLDSSAPVGKGTLTVAGDSVVASIKYFMDTQRGEQAFKTVKAIGLDQQWSYGYDLIDAERGVFNGEEVRFLKRLDAFEVSPVLRGAGINTRTLAVKGAEGLKFAEQAALATAEVEALIERSKALATLRAKEGRVLSAANRTLLSTTLDALKASGEALAELLAASSKHQAAFLREYARSIRPRQEGDRDVGHTEGDSGQAGGSA